MQLQWQLDAALADEAQLRAALHARESEAEQLRAALHARESEAEQLRAALHARESEAEQLRADAARLRQVGAHRLGAAMTARDAARRIGAGGSSKGHSGCRARAFARFRLGRPFIL